MRRPIRILFVALAVAMIFAAVGCEKKAEAPKLTPKVAPPAVAKAGVLTVGVDLQTPPFAGEDQGQKAGIDVDVAAALAEKLGLTVRYVDVVPSEVATAIAQGKVDLAMSVPIATADLTRISIAGSYLTDGPGIFQLPAAVTTGVAEVTLDNMAAEPVSVQTGSEAYWLVLRDRGEKAVTGVESLRTAIEQVSKGQAPAAAGDVVVGTYLLKDYPNVKYVGLAGPASPLGVATAADNKTLGDAARSALDELAADGVLDSIQKKWIPNMPALKVEAAK